MHPVRFRIVTSLLGGRRLETNAIAELLPDVPPATLYRHVKRLVESGILLVAEERHSRGATERIYRLNDDAAYLPDSEVESSTPAALREYFGTFVGSLLGDFERYTAKPFSLRADKARFRKLLLHCSDDEYDAFLKQLDKLIARYAALPARRDRRGRLFTNITIPEPENKES